MEIALVVEDETHVGEAQTRLSRVGLEKVTGYLAGGIRAWDAAGRPLSRTEQISVDELSARLAEKADLAVLDVRRPAEWKTGHIAGAAHMPLHELERLAAGLDRERPIAAVCAGGYRSAIAASELERLGFQKVVNVVGGMAAWNAARHETVGSSQ